MSFGKDLSDQADRAAARVENIRRNVVLRLFTAVIMDTPVETGRLRGNWQSSVSSPLTKEIDRKGQAAVDEVKAAAGQLKGNTTAFLRNNLPYAEVVEFGEYSTDHASEAGSKVTASGYSKKAPEGMVRKNVMRFVRLMNEAIRSGKV